MTDSIEQVLAIAAIGYWSWDPGSGNIACSPGLATLLGTTSADLPANSAGWLPLVHREDRPGFANYLDRLAAGHDGSTQVRLRHGDGLWRWLSLRSEPCRREAGRQLIVFRDITEQKQTEAALRDNQLRYRALYTTSPLAFILWDRQGLISEWNNRAEALFGWQAQEVVGKPIHRLLLPESERGRFRDAIDALTHHQGNGTFSGNCVNKVGRSLRCRWHNVALRTSQGTLIGLLSLILDVSEEDATLERLAKSEKTYRTLVETSPDAILLLTLDGHLLTANQQAHHLFGLDELADLQTIPFRTLLPESGDSAEFLALLDAPDECAGFIINRQLVLQSLAGQRFDAEVAVTTVMDSSGSATGIVLFARDTSDRQRATRELEQHRQHLEELVGARTGELATAHDTLAKIIDGSPVPTLVLDANHVITHWNRACERIIGTPAGTMVGTSNHWQAFYPERRPIMADLVMTADALTIQELYGDKCRPSRVVAGAFEAEDYFPAFDRWLFFTAAPLRDQTGRIVGAIETLQDVSERKLAEQALLEAKQAAEAAASAKAAFLANISHEIRTPMNAVIGLAHLLLKTELSGRQRDYVSRIQSAGQMLLGLINDVLDFSKIEAGRMHLESAEFALDDVLDNVATVLLDRAQEKGLELQYLVEPDVPSNLVGDPLRLSQVLINLVGNAIKFTARGQVTVHIHADHPRDGQVQLTVAVQDTGIGISEEQQGQLFQAFTQADNSITRRYGGSGLGLTICQRLVQLMGGDIAVRSQPGQGSTFSFTAQLGLGSPSGPEHPILRHRVLIVDDNPVARVVLERLLAKFGCTTACAESGDQALAMLAEPNAPLYDCVALDLNMPGMDGLALAHAIRARLSPMPRLVMVTAADTNSLEDAAALGEFDSVINKPLTAAQIGKLVDSLGKPLPPRNDGGNGHKAPAPLAGLRVLVAEDIPTNQLIVSETLADFGATVTIADNGNIALQLLTQPGNVYDVILMDIQMPEMDGLEATRRIRVLPRFAALPIIAMTAHALDEEKRRCREAGMNDFITKPIDPKLLLDKLSHWHAGATAAAETAPAAPPSPSADGFPVLPGVDTAEGLRRMMNKRHLYERVLRDFHQRFAEETTLIGNALAAGEREEARRRAHSTKGLAGSIGATALQNASLRLEHAIADSSPDEVAALESYGQELRQVIDGIATGLGLA